MDFPSERIHHGYLEILVVAEALVPKTLGKLSAVCDRFNTRVELNSDPVSQRDAVFQIEEKSLHDHHSVPIA